ncbi:MAG: prenyltransferase/squalene oxidase repeat-containing protein, partial [Candidatus Jordarchaeaceae archaeon]
MKRFLGILLVALILTSTFSFLQSIPTANARNVEWPGIDLNGDERVDADDAVLYMKQYFVKYDEQSEQYYWSFFDPYDVAMANSFINSVLEVERIRDQDDDITLLGFVDRALNTPGGMQLQNFDGTLTTINNVADVVEFVCENYLKNEALLNSVFIEIFKIKEIIDLLNSLDIDPDAFKSDLIRFLVDQGTEWLKYVTPAKIDWDKLTLDTKLADSAKYPTLSRAASKFRLIMKGYELVNIFVEHALIIWDVLRSEAILKIVKYYEVSVELLRFTIEFAGKLLKTLCDIYTDPAIQAALTKGVIVAAAAGATVAGPLGGVIAGAGAAIGAIVLYFTIQDIIDKGIDFAADEVLGLDLALYKKLSAEPTVIPVYPWRIKVIKIFDKDDDRFIPWGPGYGDGEDLHIWVKNIGVKKLNLRATPTKIPLGWEVSDNELDLNNYKEFLNFEPGEENWQSLTFKVKSGTVKRDWWRPWRSIWVPGENPGTIEFTFEHDIRTEWWDFFDWFPGGLKFLTKVTETFYNDVDLYIDITEGLPLYTPRNGKLGGSIDITNKKDTSISFVLKINLKDPLGEYKKYESQVSVSPTGRVNLEPGETKTFTYSWNVPSDAPIGYYQMSVDCFGETNNQAYRDNLLWRYIGFVYEIDILMPNKQHPANAGDPNNPNPILVYVTGLPPLDEDPALVVMINGMGATYELIDKLPVPIGHTLKVAAPTQPEPGRYDLEIWFVHEPYLPSKDVEKEAVEYTSAPPTEPIQKGLTWLRTRQSADGSWRGNVGVTSLATLAFLNSGYDEKDQTVRKAISYIVRNVKPDGAIYETSSWATYETSLAILPLVATRNSSYSTIIENAKNWLIKCQWDEDEGITKDDWRYGGFGYSIGVRPDLSNTQFAVLALDAAGLSKDHPLWAKLQVFLHRCQKVNFPINVTIDGVVYTVQPWNYAGTTGGYDGGFLYLPGDNP